MSGVGTLEAALAEIRRRDGKYNERAYVFVLAALEFAQTRLPARRHLTGVELAWACRDFALEQFGMLAATVLTHWGITSTDDFERVYDFAEVFKAGAGYRWPGVSSSG